MRRESHRRRGVSRASSGGWGHRAVYVGAVVATAAVIAGFGAAVLIYGPIGTPYRQLTGSNLGVPPVGVSFGSAQEVLATGALSYNNTSSGANVFDVDGYSNASSLCTAPGVYSPLGGTVVYNLTSGNITAGNTTIVCLNSVGNLTAGGPVGFVNQTWSAGLVGTGYLTDSQGYTAIPDNQSYVNVPLGQNVASCNSFTAAAGSAAWQSPWNETHINNASFVPCNTYYQENDNTSVLPSFDGVQNATFVGPGNSTVWVVNQSGYGASDVVYELPVNFASTSTNGLYEISVAIGGVTPVAQTFTFNNAVSGVGSGTVVFVFDLTAAWLFDASYGYNGTGATPANSTLPQIYGAIGLTSVVVSECTIDGVCPQQTA